MVTLSLSVVRGDARGCVISVVVTEPLPATGEAAVVSIVSLARLEVMGALVGTVARAVLSSSTNSEFEVPSSSAVACGDA